MKVAYNDCFGGFSLSPLAETEYRAKKGVILTWYKGVGSYPYKSYKKIADVSALSERDYSSFDLIASNADLGDEVKEIPNDSFFYESWYGDKDRSDPDLIEVIERLGEKANGSFARLAIKEIPDGVRFEITEYDGSEDVVPPRTNW
jgi:hypothetical protein